MTSGGDDGHHGDRQERTWDLHRPEMLRRLGGEEVSLVQSAEQRERGTSFPAGLEGTTEVVN